MMDDDSMPPRPVCEFEFNLPHGIGTDNDRVMGGTGTDSEMPASNLHDDGHSDPTENSNHEDNVASHDDNESLVPSFDQYSVTHAERSIGDSISQETRPFTTPPSAENVADHDMNYDTLQRGFSDEDDGVDDDHLSWKPGRVRKTNPESRNLPRRSENENSTGSSEQMSKRPRISLFGGGPVQEAEHEEPRETGIPAANSPPPTPSKVIRHQMSDMNIEEPKSDNERAPPATVKGKLFHRYSTLPRPSPVLSDESVVIPPDPMPIYELRQNIDRGRAITHIDTDNTGDYDPEEESRQEMLRRQKARANKAAKRIQKARKNKTKAKAKGKKTKEPRRNLIVKLRANQFEDLQWKDNWSDGHSIIETDEEPERERHGTEFQSSIYRDNTPDVQAQPQIFDPSGAVDDLTGHPAARGCRRCRQQGQNCSMVHGDYYPCEACEDISQICQPIQKPLEKARCSLCVEDGEETCESANASCAYCENEGRTCTPLPPHGYKVPRTSIDDLLYGPNRKYAQCTNCRVEKKRCSLKSKRDAPPCKHCKRHRIGCTFYDVPKATADQHKSKDKAIEKAIAKKDIMERIAPDVSQPDFSFFSPEDLAFLDEPESDDDDVVAREATPEEEMEDEAGNKGLLTKIKTPFAHPMQFAVEAEQVSDCNFCEMPTFGFVGHFEREVHVIKWYNGRGFTDVGGGHCENHGSTTMCCDCTMARLQVICCPDHELLSIVDNSSQDFSAAFDDLIQADPGSLGMKQELLRWCSLCCSTASWACVTVQPSVSGNEEDHIQGCGLRLCDRCAQSLQGQYSGDLCLLAQEMDKEPKFRDAEDDIEQESEVFGMARADVGLLHRNGLLMLSVDLGDEEDEM